MRQIGTQRAYVRPTIRLKPLLNRMVNCCMILVEKKFFNYANGIGFIFGNSASLVRVLVEDDSALPVSFVTSWVGSRYRFVATFILLV